MEKIIDRLIYPEWYMVFGFLILLMIDLLTGVKKAKGKGEATTSRGLRKTVDKSVTYSSVALSMLVIMNITSIGSGNGGVIGLFGYSINVVIGWFCHNEFKSIFENLIEINSKDGVPNDLAKRFLIPVHNRIILKFSNDYKL